MWREQGCAYGSENVGQEIVWQKEIGGFRVQQKVWQEEDWRQKGR